MRLQTLLTDQSIKDRYWTYKVGEGEFARGIKSQRFINNIFWRLVVHYHLMRCAVL